MSSSEALAVLKRLTLLFPVLVDDQARCTGLLRELEKFSRDAGNRAVDEYTTIGEKFLNPTQLFAIAYRIDRQAADVAAAADKARMRAAEREQLYRNQGHLIEADAIIADMTDDDVRHEWAPILAAMTGKPREWAETWPVAKVRGNIRLRLKIAGLVGAP